MFSYQIITRRSLVILFYWNIYKAPLAARTVQRRSLRGRPREKKYVIKTGGREGQGPGENLRASTYRQRIPLRGANWDEGPEFFIVSYIQRLTYNTPSILKLIYVVLYTWHLQHTWHTRHTWRLPVPFRQERDFERPSLPSETIISAQQTTQA